MSLLVRLKKPQSTIKVATRHKNQGTMTSCAKCQKPLIMEIEPDEEENVEMDMDETQTVPDDVHLPCGCHLHWECLLESYEISKCLQCGRDIVSNEEETEGAGSSRDPTTTSETSRIIVTLNNEGGLQEGIDIFPILKEESYLRAYPEERKCRAFLEFCREGDHHAIVDLLQSCIDEAGEAEDDMMDESEPSGPSKTPDEVLRYQDPIGDMASGLHAAVANGHREVAWLLLLLASQLSEMEFPALVFQEASALGIMRPDDMEGKVDIRSLKDARGRSAEDVAKETGVIWNGWVGNGRLAMP